MEISGIKIGEGHPLVYIGGPCAIESEESAVRHAEKIKKITDRIGVPFIYKSSFDKANRMRPDSPRGIGIKKGLKILSKIRKRFNVPVTTDVHETSQVKQVAEIVDLIQIPSFLSRQTDLIIESAKTGKPVNIKKGQFLSPWDMKHIADKALKTGNDKIILTERGTTFGYGYLVNDMRSIQIMKGFGFPVVFDAGHSVQLPGQSEGKSGGMREMIPALARAGIAAGADALFIEVHENPDKAVSDGPNMIKLDYLEKLLKDAKEIRTIIES